MEGDARGAMGRIRMSARDAEGRSPRTSDDQVMKSATSNEWRGAGRGRGR